MWRAIVLALLAYSVFQLFSPAPASAEDSKGGWVTTSSSGGVNAAYADFNEDCMIDVFDEQGAAFRYGASFGLPLYDQRHDVYPQGQTYDYPPPRDSYGVEIGDDSTISIHDLQFVFGRDSMSCLMYWDPNLSMGEYSYKSDTPTGPGTACGMPLTNPPGSDYYKDPIGVVFYGNATASRLEEEAQQHGYPTIDHSDDQRFWEVGRCTFEDVDAREDRGWTCGFPDLVCESWHFRAEVGAKEVSTQWGPWGGHVTWGTFAVATPHFDDDDNSCDHFVPEVFPYPDELYPGFQGSGFEAGTWMLYYRFFSQGHTLAGEEYWGNTQPILQDCGWPPQIPQGDGWVYYLEIP